jgi:hypothetical protein
MVWKMKYMYERNEQEGRRTHMTSGYARNADEDVQQLLLIDDDEEPPS